MQFTLLYIYSLSIATLLNCFCIFKKYKIANKKAIVEHYVKQIIIHRDTIDIEFNISGDYTITETIAR